MKPTILLISGTELCTHLQSMVDTLDLDADITFQKYRSLKDLPGLYRERAKDFDGVCITGSFARQVILRTRQDARPLYSISAKSVEYYKEFFRLLNLNRQMDFSRVVLDSDLWLRRDEPQSVLAHFNGYDFERKRSAVLGSLTVEQVMAADGIVLENAKRLYGQGKIDLVVCRLSSVIPLLQEAGIPHSFVYPDVENVQDTLNLLLNDIKLQSMNDNLPAVIFITSQAVRQNGMAEITDDNVALQRGLLDFNQQQGLDFMIQKAVDGYEVFTTQQTVQRITQNFTACRLQQHLHSRTGMKLQIGYGIGQNLLKARTNALKACRLSAAGGAGFVINENGDTIGPLDSDAVICVAGQAPPNAALAAEKAGLSVATIQRILSVTQLLGTRDITSQQLAASLQVTVANANRFLNALEKSGLAQIAAEKRSLSKGRPSKVYRISIG